MTVRARSTEALRARGGALTCPFSGCDASAAVGDSYKRRVEATTAQCVLADSRNDSVERWPACLQSSEDGVVPTTAAAVQLSSRETASERSLGAPERGKSEPAGLNFRPLSVRVPLGSAQCSSAQGSYSRLHTAAQSGCCASKCVGAQPATVERRAQRAAERAWDG